MKELPILKIIICKKICLRVSRADNIPLYTEKSRAHQHILLLLFCFRLVAVSFKNFFFCAPQPFLLFALFFYLWMKQNIDFLMTSSSSFPKAFFLFYYFFSFLSIVLLLFFIHHFSPYNFHMNQYFVLRECEYPGKDVEIHKKNALLQNIK